MQFFIIKIVRTTDPSLLREERRREMGTKTSKSFRTRPDTQTTAWQVHSYEQHGEGHGRVAAQGSRTSVALYIIPTLGQVCIAPREQLGSSSQMSLYLCVDCGGSKTSAVIVDAQGKILGRAYGGPSNFAYLTLDAFVSAVTVAVGDALKTCTDSTSIDPVPLPPSQAFAAAWFGVSGVDSPSAIATITPVLSTLLGIPVGPRLLIGNDTQLLAAPLQRLADVTHAVTVVGGTGSIAVSFEKADNGELTELGRVGGWGWILGDEGGGFHVGREVVRQILIEHDQASVASSSPPQTKLKARILDNFGVTTVPEILQTVHMTLPPETTTLPYLLLAREKRLSSLAPFVFQAAFDEADPLAINVLRTCANLLASEIAILLGDRDEARPRLVRAQDSVISFGGSLVGIESYRKMITDDLARRGHVFKLIHFVNDAAAEGARGLAAMHRITR